MAEPYMGMLSSACGRSDQSDVISSRPQIRVYVVSPSLAGSQVALMAAPAAVIQVQQMLVRDVFEG